MDTLKTAVIVVLLLAVVYGAYVVLNQPDSPLPQEIAWHEQKATEPLQIDMGTSTGPNELDPESGKAESTPSWSSAKADAEPRKPFIHAELSPEEPVPAPSLSTPSPLGLPKAEAGAASEKSDTLASDPTATTNLSAIPAPNLLTGAASSLPVAENGSEPAKPQLPTLPDLRQTEQEATTAPPAAPTLTATPIPPTAEQGTSTASGSPTKMDAVLKASLERDNVGPITAAEVATNPTPSTAGEATNPGVFEAAVQEAQLQIAAEKFNQALFILSRFVAAPDLAPQQRAQLLDMLDPLAAKVVYSREHLIESAYEVRRGEKLSDIADTYNVPWELLANINGIENPDLLVPGTKLKVVPGPFRADVDLQNNELTLFAGQLYAGRFPVSVGNDPQPKAGEYRVLEKQVGRVYYAGDGRTVAAEDPNNPYGRVWIGLGNDLCIHGSPETSEANASGCISLSPLDANDVFQILSQGSSVVIRR